MATWAIEGSQPIVLDLSSDDYPSHTHRFVKTIVPILPVIPLPSDVKLGVLTGRYEEGTYEPEGGGSESWS